MKKKKTIVTHAPSEWQDAAPKFGRKAKFRGKVAEMFKKKTWGK